MTEVGAYTTSYLPLSATVYRFCYTTCAGNTHMHAHTHAHTQMQRLFAAINAKLKIKHISDW